MTTNENAEAWRINVQSKTGEIQRLLNEVFGLLPMFGDERQKPLFQEKLKLLIEKCGALHHLYGPNMVPVKIQELTRTLQQWQGNVRDPNLIRTIAELHKPIGEITGKEPAEDVSFTVIMARHRDDKELQANLDELICALEKLIAEGDDVLTSQAAKELERVLEEIKKRRSQSLVDLEPWTQWAVVTVGVLWDAHFNTHIGTITANAFIAAKKSQTQMVKLIATAREDYLVSLNLKGSEKFSGPRQKALTEASLQEITDVVKANAGFGRLTAENPHLALENKPEAAN